LVKAPFWLPFSPSAIVSNLICTSSNRRGSPFQCSRATAPFGRSVSPPSVVSNYAAYSAPPSVTMRALHPRHQTTLRVQPQGGLSLPVQQSCSSLLDAVRVPPSLGLNFFTYSTSDGAPPTGAAEP
ncbi:hypothetical protein M9458_006209, partial [Cirrhinus mrigala]